MTAPVITGMTPRATLLAALDDAIESRRDQFAFCRDCSKALGGTCPDHEEDEAAAVDYMAVAALLETISDGEVAALLRGKDGGHHEHS